MVRTYQPKKRQRSKEHGFRKRMSIQGAGNQIPPPLRSIGRWTGLLPAGLVRWREAGPPRSLSVLKARRISP